MHVESSLHASIRPKTSQITVKVQVQLEKNQQKHFQGQIILFLHYYCAFHKHANSEVQKPTDDCIFRCRQSS